MVAKTRLTFWLGGLVAAAAIAACAGARPAGGGALTRAEERKLGERVVAQVRREFRVLDDPYLDGYLRDVGTRVARAMGADTFDLRFHVVADPRINAFAVPGGHVFVTSQTILSCADEAELAGVIAHEIGHVEGRHIAHRMEKAAKVNLGAMAAVLAGAFLGNPKAGAAIATFGVAGAQAKMLQYSREDEEDADRRAARALVAAGYDPWGLVRFMETIRRSSPTPEGVPAYLFTHPLPENRSVYLADLIPPGTELPPPDPDRLWRAQARVLVEDPRPWGEDLFRQRTREAPGRPASWLGLALLLRERGLYEEALDALGKAEALAPGDPEILHERAATWLRQGRTDEAVSLLERLRSEGRATAPALRDLGWAYLEAERGEDALAVYDELARLDPGWEELPYYRGMALGKAGKLGEGHALLGDYYREKGRPDLAARHYRQALEHLPPGERRAEVEEALRSLRDRRPGQE
ncbi:M48 family metalloprotease [Deferrisoma palaeochoriense]